MSPKSIQRSNMKAQRAILKLRLAEFRKAMKADQSALKGFSQPAVSRIEGRGDIKLSTLVEYCHALGATVQITARKNKKSGDDFVLYSA